MYRYRNKQFEDLGNFARALRWRKPQWRLKIRIELFIPSRFLCGRGAVFYFGRIRRVY